MFLDRDPKWNAVMDDAGARPSPGRMDLVHASERDAKILGALLARRAGNAEMLIRAHIGASRAAVRHINLHRLSQAAQQGAREA